MRNFVLGFVAGVMVSAMFGGLVGVLFAMKEGPTFETSWEYPRELSVGKVVEVRVKAANTQAEAMTLDSIDVDESLLEGFQILHVEPKPADSMNFAGQRSWSFDHEVPAGQSVDVMFRLKPLEAGHFSGSMDVCTPAQDYTSEFIDVVVGE